MPTKQAAAQPTPTTSTSAERPPEYTTTERRSQQVAAPQAAMAKPSVPSNTTTLSNTTAPVTKVSKLLEDWHICLEGTMAHCVWVERIKLTASGGCKGCPS